MGNVSANGIQIEFEEFGDARDPAILLIMGHGAQMIVWPESFCRSLADRSFRVIRFDNRDVGLSTHLDGVRAPGMMHWMLANLFNLKPVVPYTLDDMALDAVGLLDTLGIQSAHFIGASMGGMIAQIAAANHSARVLSLTSIMSTSGSPTLPGPQPKLLRHMLFGQKRNMTPDARIKYLVRFLDLIGSPGYPTPPDERKRYIRSSVNRAFNPAGNVRQFAAMVANGDRTKLLESIELPALVIHGEDDPLISVAGGRHTASCIRDAQLAVIPGMGHDLPEQLMPTFADLIATHCGTVENNRRGETATGSVVA